MLTLRWDRLVRVVNQFFLFRYIETNHPKEVNHSGVSVVLIHTLFVNTGRWAACSWALFFFFLLSLFSETSISEAGRLQEGDGTVILRGFNVVYFLFTPLRIWYRGSCGLFDCDLFQICTDAMTHCLAVLLSHKGLLCLPVSVSGCLWKCVAHVGLVACILYQTSVHQESILFSQTLCNVAKSCVCDECITQKLWLWLRHKSQKDRYT